MNMKNIPYQNAPAPIICVCAQKGGSAKSTTAVNLACNLKLRGFDPLLVDTDPQGSSVDWYTDRVSNDEYNLPPIGFEVQQGQKINKTLIDKTSRYDVIIVDVAGVDTSEMRSALEVASLAVCPIQVSYFDMKTLNKFDSVMSRALERNESLKAFMLQTISPSAPLIIKNEREELLEILTQTKTLDNKIFNTVITRKTSQKYCLTNGMSVNEFLSRKGEVFVYKSQLKQLNKLSKTTISKYSPVKQYISLTDEICVILGLPESK